MAEEVGSDQISPRELAARNVLMEKTLALLGNPAEAVTITLTGKDPNPKAQGARKTIASMAIAAADTEHPDVVRELLYGENLHTIHLETNAAIKPSNGETPEQQLENEIRNFIDAPSAIVSARGADALTIIVGKDSDPAKKLEKTTGALTVDVGIDTWGGPSIDRFTARADALNKNFRVIEPNGSVGGVGTIKTTTLNGIEASSKAYEALGSFFSGASFKKDAAKPKVEPKQEKPASAVEPDTALGDRLAAARAAINAQPASSGK